MNREVPMSQRFLFLFALVTGLAVAAGQTPAKPEAASQAQAQSPTKPEASHRRVALGGFSVGAGYFSGPWYPYGYPYYYRDPFFWPLALNPGYYYGFSYGPNLGDVKISGVSNKSATVYIDGGLAGPLSKLKDMWLEPGVYRLEIQDGNQRLSQKIYVLSRKTIKVTPEMMDRGARQ
jgi:hypothetical protein